MPLTDLTDLELAALRALDDVESQGEGLHPTLHGLQHDYIPDRTTARLAQVMTALIRERLAEASDEDPFLAVFRLTDRGRAVLAQEG